MPFGISLGSCIGFILLDVVVALSILRGFEFDHINLGFTKFQFTPIRIKTRKEKLYASGIMPLLILATIILCYQSACSALLCSVDAQTHFANAEAHAKNAETLVEDEQSHEALQEWQAAIAEYTRAVNKGYTPVSEAYIGRAFAYGRLEEWQDAIDDYTLAIDNNYTPLYVPHFNRAIAYRRIDDDELDNALQDIDIVLTIAPNYPCTHIARGDIFYDRVELEFALDSYNRLFDFEASERQDAKCNEARANTRIPTIEAALTATAAP